MTHNSSQASLKLILSSTSANKTRGKRPVFFRRLLPCFKKWCVSGDHLAQASASQNFQENIRSRRGFWQKFGAHMRHGSGGLDHKKRATSKSSKWVIHLSLRSFFVATNHEIFVVSFSCGVDLDSHVRIFHGFPDCELSMEQVHAIRRQKLVPDGLLCLGWPKKKEPCEGGGS